MVVAFCLFVPDLVRLVYILPVLYIPVYLVALSDAMRCVVWYESFIYLGYFFSIIMQVEVETKKKDELWMKTLE